MQAILPWLLVGLTLIAAWPWAHWLLARYSSQDDGPWLASLLALALSTGTLTLVMFWQALAGVRLDVPGIAIPYFALMLPGGWLWWRGGHPGPTLPYPRSKLGWLAALVLVAIAGGVIFNSVYWPFWRDDALGNYARFGAYMAENRALAPLPGNLTVHEAYPILIPLTYTYTYLVAGWPHEFLARLFPALLSLGCLGTAYTLGYRLRGPLAGWISALLLALTPTFVSWASSGYVDLPMAFFYSLSAIFTHRLWDSRRPFDALMAGVMMGLAAWTKNAALLGVLFLAVWLGWMFLRRRIGWAHVALALGACAAVAGPWYLRNLIEANLLIPDTAWTDQAKRTAENLFVLVAHPEIYSLPGALILVSVASALIVTIRRRLAAPGLMLLLCWSLPFFAAWWLWVSYDPRFILLFLPLLCAIAGDQLATGWRHLAQRWQRIAPIPVVLVLLALALPAVWNSVEFKDNILRQPIMTPDERRTVIFSQVKPWRLQGRTNRP